MANVIKVLGTPEGNGANVSASLAFPPEGFKVKSGTTGSIVPGALVIKDGSNAGYAKAAADGTASTSVIIGVAADASNETASADGNVHVITAPVLLVSIKAKTPGSLATSLLLDKYVLDVTSGNYTLDQGTSTNGIFRLMDYDNTTDGNCIATLACNL